MPSTVTEPELGSYSPAISLSRVLLPAPFGATRPVRPAPTVNDRSVNCDVSSDQEKDRFEQTMEDMRHLSSRANRTGGSLRVTRRCRLPACLQPPSCLNACRCPP